MVGRILVSFVVCLVGCHGGAGSAPSHDAGRSAGRTPREPPAPMPSPEFTADAGPTACFPRGFRATRLRAMDTYVELCGVVPGGGAQCFAIDPLAQHVGALTVRDAPTTVGDLPELEAPITRVELSIRGAQLSSRGGALTVTGPAGTRTVRASAVAFGSLDNAAMVPWAHGRQFALIGWREPDLGSMTLIDPSGLRMQGKAADVPCPGP